MNSRSDWIKVAMTCSLTPRPCITRVCKWLKILMAGGFADLTRM